MAEFRAGNSRVLITTDVWARGLDVQQVRIPICSAVQCNAVQCSAVILRSRLYRHPLFRQHVMFCTFFACSGT